MIIIKQLKGNNTIIIDDISEDDGITNVKQLKEKIFKKCNTEGKLILCGAILDDNLKINEIKEIYKYWNGKIIYL